MLLPNRNGSSVDYRYGFNGMEKDDELKGIGNSYDFGARMYDPRVGRWFAIDRYDEYFPQISPYAYSLNSPLMFTDKNGDFPWLPFVKGAMIAAFSEITFQMIDYMILQGDFNFNAALKNLDMTDIFIEAGKGGLLGYAPFSKYTATKISRLFKGKYRAYTFYLMKESIIVVQDVITDVSKDYLNGKQIDVVDILGKTLGNKMVGEIMSSTPLVPKALKKTGRKITKKLDKAVRITKKVQKLEKKLKKAIKNGNKKKADRLMDRIHTKAQKIDKLESQATTMLAGEYGNSGWAESFKGEFTSRAKQTVKKYVEKNASKIVLTVEGLLTTDDEGFNEAIEVFEPVNSIKRGETIEKDKN